MITETIPLQGAWFGQGCNNRFNETYSFYDQLRMHSDEAKVP
jgi:hypothetical protein